MVESPPHAKVDRRSELILPSAWAPGDGWADGVRPEMGGGRAALVHSSSILNTRTNEDSGVLWQVAVLEQDIAHAPTIAVGDNRSY
jgi:hypothetical protein